jgi:hypothetical protein
VLYRIDEAVVTVMRVINRRDLERILRQLRGTVRIRSTASSSRRT